LHESAVQALPSLQVGAVPAWQAPEALQVSLPLQALPSEQGVPAETLAKTQPVAGLQLSEVQGFESAQVSAVPAWHTPEALQVSLPLHAFPSLQDEPAARLV